MSRNVLIPASNRSVQNYEPVTLQSGVVVDFQKVTVGQNVEIRINAKKQDADVGHLSYVSDSGHLYMTVDVKVLGAAVAKEVADTIYDGFTQLTAAEEADQEENAE